jgi:cold shock protein
MSRDRSTWAPRKRGFDDDEPFAASPRPRFVTSHSEADIAFEPQPQSAPQPAPQGGQTAAGTIKWFNDQKGYGFVELPGQGDAFLHVNVLQSIGRDSAPPGAKVRVIVGAGAKGPQVAKILEIDTAGAAVPARPPRPSIMGRAPRGFRRPDPATAVSLSGKVKWFNEVRGFGFVAGEDGGKDVFVHITTLGAAGVTQLAEGQSINMKLVETPKGREAIAVAL